MQITQKLKLPLFLVMAVVLAGLFAINATAQEFLTADEFFIDEVTVNDVDFEDTVLPYDASLTVEAGDTLFITVKLDSNFVLGAPRSKVEDVNIEAEIRGIEKIQKRSPH